MTTYDCKICHNLSEALDRLALSSLSLVPTNTAQLQPVRRGGSEIFFNLNTSRAQLFLM